MRRWFWVLDVVVVVAFVIIGREDHGMGLSVGDSVRVAAPFLIGLGVSTVAVRAWRNPTSLLAGLELALGSVVIGMLLRRVVWVDGTATAFVIVTTAFMTAGMVGWRLVAGVIARFASGSAAAS